MSNSDSIKKQRDQFLAFAFASADFLLEIDPQGMISFAVGASKSLTGQDLGAWIGKAWLDLFAPYERAALEALQSKAKPGLRQGPGLFDFNPDMESQKGIVTAIYMPENPNFYVTVSFSDALAVHLAEITQVDANRQIMDAEQFTLAAKDAALKAKSLGQNIQICVFDLDISEDDRSRFGAEQMKETIEGLNTILMDSAMDGRSAAQINDNRYSVLQHEGEDILSLQGKIEDYTKAQDPDGRGVFMTSKAVTSKLDSIEPHDVSKAIVYTVREFERTGTQMTITDLNSGFDSYAKANAQRVEELKSFIERSDFRVNFQPIIHFETKEVAYYEMRCSFEQGDTEEWVVFGEDVGLSAAFDLAICERAISYINYKAGNTRAKFSINISAESFEDVSFYKSLKDLLDANKGKNIADRLMFEITEAAFISNIKRMSAYIEALSTDGFTVMLDDFDPNGQGMDFLKALNAHGVKVDRKITNKIASSPADFAALKHLTTYCLENNKTITAKAVEDDKQVSLLRDIGLTLGQGYYFGKPTPVPEYNGG